MRQYHRAIPCWLAWRARTRLSARCCRLSCARHVWRRATEPDHVAAEAADLIYFAMTRCVAAGVNIAAIESHLDRRALKLNRRPGNDKKERIAAADAILAKKGPARRMPKWLPRVHLSRWT